MVLEEDNLQRSNENLIDDNRINDNVLDASNVDVGINDHFIPPLDTYDPRNCGIFDANIRDILIEKGPIKI